LNDNFCHAYSPPSLLMFEFLLLDSHQCNRTRPYPAISNFYPRLPRKSRDKLCKRRSASLCNHIVNRYRNRKVRRTLPPGLVCHARRDFRPRENSCCRMALRLNLSGISF
jgi:hypothetical protein